jgi:hypothetical protein
MIGQPTSTVVPPAGVEQEMLFLRTQLDDALTRINRLEQQVAGTIGTGASLDLPGAAGATEAAQRVLLPLDSPAMKVALELCAEVFPGSRTKLEVMTDPDDPSRSWRLITVYWKSAVRAAIDQQTVWHNRFDAVHPEAIHDISLFVVPE